METKHFSLGTNTFQKLLINSNWRREFTLLDFLWNSNNPAVLRLNTGTLKLLPTQ